MESIQATPINHPFHTLGRSHELSSFVTVLEKIDPRKSHTTTKVEGTIQPAQRVFTVAISGCTSSGKTTLALLLSEIFSSFPPKESSADNDSPLGSEKENLGDSQATTSFATPFTTTIHQDAFFIPKVHCPFVEFSSTHKDKSFMKESVAQIYENPIYFYSWTGKEGEGIARIAGPNTDCMDAVDFGNLLRKVKAAQRNKIEPEKDARYKDDADKKQLIQKYSGVIASMRKRVKEHFALPTTNHTSGYGGSITDYINGWVFVEGFLLFSKTMPSDNQCSGLDDCSKDDLHAEGLKDLQPEVNEEVMAMDKQLIRMKTERIPSKDALMQEFDVKLFLPTTKEVAKHRRMSRFPYVDFPVGGRHLGQMWKSEGYFEDVVWKDYQDSFGWLLTETGKENVDGVFVRTTFDDTVENTVEWAVGIILRVLSSRGKN
ncbi:hypothetical protein SBOR_2121 [Sclerotinia borealis F-4128]|uniref:Nicotinamide riboside kinase 1 n=1 Tax=Sclerotinia borealis (strain F-4128) TaxID=1432307 RepID=W9CKW5_SCLBF|nr:hypothetical protein SBOR_2121 [Sclerotinia borealis F-4128]